jgi:hypothetical protein
LQGTNTLAFCFNIPCFTGFGKSHLYLNVLYYLHRFLCVIKGISDGNVIKHFCSLSNFGSYAFGKTG